jgi:hypothetical protein
MTAGATKNHPKSIRLEQIQYLIDHADSDDYIMMIKDEREMNS